MADKKILFGGFICKKIMALSRNIFSTQKLWHKYFRHDVNLCSQLNLEHWTLLLIWYHEFHLNLDAIKLLIK